MVKFCNGKRQILVKKERPLRFLSGLWWQPDKDSNPDKQSQSLSCYHYTIRISNFICLNRLFILYKLSPQKSIPNFYFFDVLSSRVSNAANPMSISCISSKTLRNGITFLSSIHWILPCQLAFWRNSTLNRKLAMGFSSFSCAVRRVVRVVKLRKLVTRDGYIMASSNSSTKKSSVSG